MKLTIGYLYPELMNIYGDTGNIICLTKRCQWRGIEVTIKNISLKTRLKKSEVDLYFFGGGQDQAQDLVSKDLVPSKKGKIIKIDVERGVPLLSICGGYQLLGEYYRPFINGSNAQKGPKIAGLGIFPIFTEASNDRMIGNLVISSSIIVDFKKNFSRNREPISNNYLIGFENHSGKTYLKSSAKPLGKVIKGFGNNGADKTEGCVYKNAIGCYMHGSLLPKNPQLADWLIKKALEIKYDKEIKLSKLDDNLEITTHNTLIGKIV